MVRLTFNLLRIKPDDLGKHLKKSFIDKLRVYVKSGQGGDGSRQLGGIGGNGGSIILKANSSTTLKNLYSANLKKRFIAQNGENSKKLKLFGSNGEDIVITCPTGITAVTDSGQVIGDLNETNEQLVVARGGKGGCSSNRWRGQSGEQMSINLDLKLIADVGLIGFPNAGKSTFLSLVSRARPKIANYPFTTLQPQIGSIEYDDTRTISLADLPGLVEGAHLNRGMGHKFLKHISRTKINLFLVDINGFQLNQKSDMRSAFETVIYLVKELELYDSSLVEKPSILVLNKMDIDGAEEKLKEFTGLFQDYDNSVKAIEAGWLPERKAEFKRVFNISAKNNSNVEDLCMTIRELIDTLDEKDRNKNNKLVNNHKMTNKHEMALSDMV